MKNKGSQADLQVAGLVRKSRLTEMIGKDGDAPGVSARILAVILRYVPKFGVLEPLNFKIPTPEAEILFAESFDVALQDYRRSLQVLPEKMPALQDYDLDTGFEAQLGEYQLADQTFAKLLIKLADEDFKTASDSLKADGLQYFANMPPPPDYRREKKHYKKIKSGLQMLESTSQVPATNK
jgi:hypothetical protein